MESSRVIEHSTVKITCQVDFLEATVNWFFEGIEIGILKGHPNYRKWFEKIRAEEDGRERYLIIEDVPREAEGLFECKTICDKTEMKLSIAPVNEFLKPLEDQACSEGEEVLDEEGDAEWRVAGELVTEDNRVQSSGGVSCTSGQIETKAEVVVEAKVQDAAARKQKQPQVTRHRNKFVK